MNNLQKQYYNEIRPALIKKFGMKPVVNKVTINVGLGSGLKEQGYAENVVGTLLRITGQKPIITKAKKSISSFKIREGMSVGVKVTLRGERMWDFLEKLVKITFPRVRDFRGISDKGFDGQGNYSIGFKEYIAFPEINPDEIDKVHGLEIAISTTAKKDDLGRELLYQLGFPFKKDEK
jgi:large subunit ribosomal protein L5